MSEKTFTAVETIIGQRTTIMTFDESELPTDPSDLVDFLNEALHDGRIASTISIDKSTLEHIVDESGNEI